MGGPGLLEKGNEWIQKVDDTTKTKATTERNSMVLGKKKNGFQWEEMEATRWDEITLDGKIITSCEIIETQETEIKHAKE